ncbi:FtsX-like permease family protein [Bacteroides sp.]|uniref:FtsX-like permease family protein n=1 Tax=Bacteroides sp. TaxID=29523 RepID=UPI003A9459F1
MGLLSISLFDIRQRYREIGLREVNGAQATDIYPLLIKKYLSVLAVATLISIPVSGEPSHYICKILRTKLLLHSIYLP